LWLLLSVDMSREVGLMAAKDVKTATRNWQRTERVSALLEVVKESLAHAEGAPFVLLVYERHVCGLRVAVVEGQAERSCAGEASRVACGQV
jgi:hypothetical protein